MRRIFLAALVLALGLTAAARGDDDALRRRVLALSQVTGEEPTAATLKQLLASPDQTKKLFVAAVAMTKEKDGLGYNAAYLLALASGEMKDLKMADFFYRECMPQAVKLQSVRKIIQSYSGLMDVLFDNKKYADCAKVCREFLELKTDDGKDRLYMVWGQHPRTGEHDYLPAEFEPLKRLRPGIHRLLIQTLAKQGKHDAALKMADNLIRAQDHWQERQLKGWILREAGRFAEAVRAYEDVLDRVEKDMTLEPEDKDYYLERYRYILSNVHVDLKQIDKAAEKLKQLIGMKPEEPGYYNDLGYIWADNGMNLEESEKLIRKALDLDRAKRKKLKVAPEEDRDSGAYLDSLAWVLFKQKRYKEAKVALLEAVKDKNAHHIEIYDHLGDIHLALGEKAAAVAAWRRGLEVAGDTPREVTRRAEVEKKIQAHSGK